MITLKAPNSLPLVCLFSSDPLPHPLDSPVGLRSNHINCSFITNVAMGQCTNLHAAKTCCDDSSLHLLQYSVLLAQCWARLCCMGFLSTPASSHKGGELRTTHTALIKFPWPYFIILPLCDGPPPTHTIYVKQWQNVYADTAWWQSVALALPMSVTVSLLWDRRPSSFSDSESCRDIFVLFRLPARLMEERDPPFLTLKLLAPLICSKREPPIRIFLFRPSNEKQRSEL